MLSGGFEHIVILIAMAAEAQPLIQRLNLKPEATDFAAPYPHKLFSGQQQGKKISIILNGTDSRFKVDNVGTQAAALTTFLTLKHLQPDLVINAGTAGAFHSKGAKIGDIYLSQKIKFHDRRIGIPGFTEYGVGDYSSFDVAHLASKISAKLGVVSTGNSLDMSDIDLKMLQQNQADVKEMEAASIAWVADIFGTPMFSVKAVTDLVDVLTPSEKQFLENLLLASNNLQEAVIKILAALDSDI